MEIFYFRGETYQIVVPSATFKEAIKSFGNAIKNIYGETLRVWELDSTYTITVYWREEGEAKMTSDIFQIGTLPQNTAISLVSEEENYTFHLPENLILKGKMSDECFQKFNPITYPSNQ